MKRTAMASNVLIIEGNTEGKLDGTITRNIPKGSYDE